MAILCPRCGEPADDDAAQCRHCGAKILEDITEGEVAEEPSYLRMPPVALGLERSDGAEESQSKWQQHLETGTELTAEQQYDEAIAELSHALVEAPEGDVHRCYAARALAYLGAEDRPRAIADCELALENNSHSAEALATRATAYAGQEKWRPAMDDLLSAIHVGSEATDDYRQRLRKLVDDAIDAFSEIVNTGDVDVALFENRGLAYSIRGDYDDAIRDFSLAIQLDSNVASVYGLRAEAYLETEQFEAAVDDCSQVIQLHADDAINRYRRGHAQLSLGKAQAAVDDLSIAITMEPNYTEALFDRGRAHQGIGNHDAALDDYARVVSLDPVFHEAYILHGVLLAAGGDHSPAVEDFSAALALDEDDAETYFKRAGSHLELGLFDAALADYASVVQRDALCAPAYVGRGKALLRQEKHKLAATELTKAIRLDTQLIEAYDLRSIALLALDRFEDVLTDADKVFQLDATTPRATTRYRRGVSLAALGRHDEALADFNEALRVFAGAAEWYIHRAEVFAHLGRWREATEDIERAIAVDSIDREDYESLLREYHEAAVAHYNELESKGDHGQQHFRERGISRHFLGDLDEAHTDLTQAIALDSSDAISHWRRGVLLAQRSEHTEAIEDYTQSLTLDSDQSDVYFHRGRSYQSLGKHAEAVADHTAALEKDPELGEAFLARGEAYLRLEQFSDSKKDLDQGVALCPDLARGYFLRGRYYIRQKETEQALQEFTAAIERDPTMAIALWRRGQILAKQQRYDEAIADYEAAATADTSLTAPHCDRAIALAMLRKPWQAIIDLTKAAASIQYDVRFAAVLETRGKLYYAVAQDTKAAKDFSAVIELRPPGHNFARTLYARGLACCQLDEFDRAKADFDRALRLRPNYPAAKEASQWAASDHTKPLAVLKRKVSIEAIRKPPVVGQPTQGDDDHQWQIEPMWDQWILRTGSGAEFGPVDKQTLDAWGREGRFDDRVRLLRMEMTEWLWVGDVYGAIGAESYRAHNRPIPLNAAPQQTDEETDPFEAFSDAPEQAGEYPLAEEAIDPIDVVDEGEEDVLESDEDAAPGREGIFPPVGGRQSKRPDDDELPQIRI